MGGGSRLGAPTRVMRWLIVLMWRTGQCHARRQLLRIRKVAKPESRLHPFQQDLYPSPTV